MLYMEKQLWEVLENKKDNYPLKIQIMDTMDNKTHWKDISIDTAKQIVELIDARDIKITPCTKVSFNPWTQRINEIDC